MDVGAVASALRREATETNERRLLVLSGEQSACHDAAASALDAAGIHRSETTLVGSADALGCERVAHRNADELLGRTREAIVFDAHDGLPPNALGRIVGAVDGGGLLVLCTPPLEDWPTQPDPFDEALAVPPFSADDVTGNFRQRFVERSHSHRGIAILDVDTGHVECDGLTDTAPRLVDSRERTTPRGDVFPDGAYDACLTDDQAAAVRSLESLAEASQAVVVEADRGRGKSSAAGLAAGSLAAQGDDVLVTAPEFRSAEELFARASELLDVLGVEREPRDAPTHSNVPRRIDLDEGGSLRFADPTTAAGRAETADVLVVDEAAAFPVGLLERFLAADRVAFATTVHGYEGAGRGFSVRFRDRLDESVHEVTDVSLTDPIRYAPGDPVEVWAFDALLLDARPAVDPLAGDATPERVEHRALSATELLADEILFRETFGLLVLAHYRTEPSDLVRLLDAPNLTAHALLFDGHVVSVALLAREGGLSAEQRARMYDGERVRGNLLPDLVTTQLRDEHAAVPTGWRVLRIATHHAARSRGLGSALLDAVREHAIDEGLDWLGVAYGATPELLHFWETNGFSTLHLSTTRNDTSGEHSAIMIDPLSEAGHALRDRTAERFRGRIASVLSDALDDADPDIVRATLRTIPGSVSTDLTDWEWRVVVGAAYGPGLYDVSPRPFRRLALAYFVESPTGTARLADRQERLLVLRVLQATDWETVTERLGYHSTGECKRAVGAVFQPLVDRYGTETALEERARYRD
ncbi:tRNA(Met) cytidine acetyltransferase TmcA [Natranaeroarchaeum aerophilus]|uniref:tRNA(Met) cytidine acetyltransferase TmcA n=1 Tax=Natranaeroarchaeum aerophilus TaxID=2917711 RepID=A0AAE3FS39_9EURY|nr:tRNA(Met) cytidine acetyltransferase TmcA [Natranaeroarchaeum aerophilus]MCL9814095.1 GNAT family N-acetyltransferase [Natranaeroarchaeum aerophilus]